MSAARVIKGSHIEKWDEAQQAQHDRFIYIIGNGSKWAGQEEDDVAVLVQRLREETLDPRFEDSPDDETPFWSVNPCVGVRNPDYAHDDKQPQWIDGPRMYACDGVVRFFGNFLTYSHGFQIDTNDAATIAVLQAAIQANVESPAYQAARAKSARKAAA